MTAEADRVGARAPKPSGAPVPRDEVVRRRFESQKQRDTDPELALRRELHRRGLRYRVDHPLPIPRRRGDIVFTRQRVAVFIDGCFWHGCPVHASAPKHNAAWWTKKLTANKERDRDTDAKLTAAGWCSVRVWEHEDTAMAADRVEEVVRAR